jgi:hypothetical protein
LYTNEPKRRRSEYSCGRSGDAEMHSEDYRKLYAVSRYIWEYIQQFRHRHSSQPPPKSFTDKHEFEHWLFKKMRHHIVGKMPTEEELWSHTWSVLRHFWAPRRVGFPECGWHGWHFSEHDFLSMEYATRHAFRQGFGVVC